jgi:hypothetical protein
MSTRKIPGSKAGRCVRLMTYHLLVLNVKKIRGLNLSDPHGPVQACSGTALDTILELHFRACVHIFEVCVAQNESKAIDSQDSIHVTGQ